MTAAAIFGIVAAVLSAAGAAYSAYAAADTAATNKRATEAETAYRVRSEENEATRIRNKGLEAEARQRRETAQLLSRQRAQLGASGVDIDAGSALALQEDTTTLGELEELEVREHFEDQALQMDMRAKLTEARGKDLSNFYSSQRSSALIGGAINVTASLAGGSSGFSSSGSLTDSFTSNEYNSANVDAVNVNNIQTSSNSSLNSSFVKFASKWEN